MTDRKSKRAIICLSSESESESEPEPESEEEETDDDIACDDVEEDSEEEYGTEDSDDDDEDDEILSERVIRCLREGKNLDSLTLKDCKAYLRTHGLRMAGTKAICIQRVKEHWRMKDGNGESWYPRSSFVVNCTGDVCRGDTVLFTQKVYAKYDKVTRHGGFIGKRTVAGRVIKESYGATKQQHTFTVEVLWSRGIRKLPPLFPLLVKGRNLYKMRTFRQVWDNEAERRQVLAEKHRRGAAARGLRAMKARKRNFSENRGVKNQRHSHFGRQTLNRKDQGSRRRGHAV